MCPQCQGKASRVIHSTPVIFKGSGFYVTDSRKHSKTEGHKEPEKSKTEGHKEPEKSKTEGHKEPEKSKTEVPGKEKEK